jgi:hypothetical protein
MYDQSSGFRAIIEAQRGILIKIESLLGCLVVALEYSESSDVEKLDPSIYADVASIARVMISDATEQLDSVNLDYALGNAAGDSGESMGPDANNSQSGMGTID